MDRVTKTRVYRYFSMVAVDTAYYVSSEATTTKLDHQDYRIHIPSNTNLYHASRIFENWGLV